MLHPQIAAVLASLPPLPPGPLDPGVLRAGEAASLPPVSDRTPVASIVDADASGVPVRIYTPDADARHGVLVYVHGGAFFLGSLETGDELARRLATATGLLVVSVGYRLAPEHRFPAGLDDCFTVVRWVAERGHLIGWDGQTLAVAGDSSGGNFAAAVAATAHDDGVPVTHQVLFYPSVDLDFDTTRYASLVDNATGYGLETAGLKPFNAFYVDSGADPDDPRVSPIKRADLSGLAPALIVTAECDPLRDEGEEYGRRLAAAGVPTTVTRVEGANHGFIANFPDLFPGVFTDTAAFLRGQG